MNSDNSEWQIWNGRSQEVLPGGESDSPVWNRWMNSIPPWRSLRETGRASHVGDFAGMDEGSERRGKVFRGAGGELLEKVNMALWLRRPILVEGEPGIGKSSLAYSIAWCLGLGEVLRWEIGSRTQLQDGLYDYDAVGHLRSNQSGEKTRIENHVYLGPLGSALVGHEHQGTLIPRVLLVDEIDKSDYDLPNDLLHILEEARFEIRELKRVTKAGEKVELQGHLDQEKICLSGSVVSANVHPIVVMTSNSERQFPEAFRRRCIQISLSRPEGEELVQLVNEHFGVEDPREAETPLLTWNAEMITGSGLNDRPDRLLQNLFMQMQGMHEEDLKRLLESDDQGTG